MADKKADAEHPYGHARYEYLSGMIVAFMIMVIGIEVLKSSFSKILNPEDVKYSIVAIAVLIISILVKIWLSCFNNSIGKKIKSNTLIATAQDSRNDVISTSAVLMGIIISHLTKLNFDGWIGLAVSVFILYSGALLIKDTIDPILGKTPDPELVELIHNKVMSYPQVIGIHDLIVHDYGPCRQFASVHVEMAAESDPIESHDIIDNIERDLMDNDNIFMVVHYDPIVTNDERVTAMNEKVKSVLGEINEDLHFHDLRLVPGISHNNVIFDCVRPHKFSMSDEELKAEIIRRINIDYPDYYCVITVETSFSDGK